MRLRLVAVALSFVASMWATEASPASSSSLGPRPKAQKAPRSRAMRAAHAPPSADAPPPLPPVPQVIDRINDLFRADSAEARFSMTVVTDRYRRELVLQSFTRGKTEALIVVRAPAREAGTATLRSDEALWSYAPRADRLVRIPNSLFSDSWMGSHFTNDDLMRDTDFVRDYDASLAWTEESGRRLLLATLKPRPDAPVVWSRIAYLLEPRDYLPLRADYFDGERIARTLTFTNPRVVDGRRVPHSLRMVPTGKPGESTSLEYQEIRFGAKIDPGVFTQRALRRGVRP
jgi:hypothetical protein